MPTYIYKREDGTTFEIEQRITEDVLTVCPTTGQPVKRVITGGTGLIFKGSGFYLTDYARSGANGNGEQKSAEKSNTASTETKSESKSTDGGSAAKSESKAA